jgi:nitroreductase
MAEGPRNWERERDRKGLMTAEDRKKKLERLVRYAVMAPSTHNSQPWQFRVREDRLEVWADRSRSLPIADPAGRELAISCGAAIQFAHLAARNDNFEGLVELLPDPSQPDLFARLRLGPSNSPTPREKRRFASIDARRTSRMLMESAPGREQKTDSLGSLASAHGVRFEITRDPGLRNDIANLVAEAELTLMSDSGFRKELAAWIKSAKSRAHDGMSIRSFGFFDGLSRMTGGMLGNIGGGLDTGEAHRQLVLNAPVIGVLASTENNTRAWLQSGMALADIVLELAAHGLSASFFSQPLYLEDTRERLAELFDLGAWPQMLVRFGSAPDIPAAARRDPEEVTITD